MQQPSEYIGRVTHPVTTERRSLIKTVMQRAGYKSIHALRKDLGISERTMKTVTSTKSKLGAIAAHIKLAAAANMTLEEYFALLLTE